MMNPVVRRSLCGTWARGSKAMGGLSMASCSRSFSASPMVVAEHADGALAAGTLHALKAASELDDKVAVLVAGTEAQCSSAVKQLSEIPCVAKVLTATGESFSKGLAEPLAPVVASCQKDGGFSHVVAASNTFGKNLLPRVAALLDVQPVADITEIVSEDTFVRPIYAGNAIATVQSTDEVKIITVRTTNFDKIESGDAGSPEIVAVPVEAFDQSSEWVSEEIACSDRPELTSAKTVVSGGRALKSGENFETVLEPLADALTAAVGASRAAVDAGYVSNDMQVGQTGKVVAPDLYVAAGISGAIQHLAGMKDSKVIVAINSDEEAPIFQVSDFGLKADLFEALPQLTEAIKAKKAA